MLKVKLRPIAERLLRLAARSKLIVAVAIFLRDQCRKIIWRSLVSGGPSLDQNGEERLLKLIAPGAARFVDVGANVGTWSALCVAHCPNSPLVLAFEPSTSALAELHGRFSHGEPIEIIPKAVGDRVGTTRFFEEPQAGERSSVVAGFSRKDAATRQVDVTTIDEELILRSWDSVDFLKIDTEGYDYFALKGALKAITEQRIGLLQFEYNKPWATAGATLIAAITLLTDNNYRVFLLKEDGLYEFPYAKYGEYFNYSNYVGVSPAFMPRVAGFIRGRV